MTKFSTEEYVRRNFTYWGNFPQVRIIHWDCSSNDNTGHLYVNSDKNLFYCHKCGYKGWITRLVSDYEKIPYKKAQEMVSIEPYPTTPTPNLLESITSVFGLTSIIEKSASKVVYPKEHTFITDIDTSPEWVQDFINRRRLADSIVYDYKFGYCQYGDYKHRVVIPMYENGELVFWVARDALGVHPVRYLNPHGEKNSIVFNIDRAKRIGHAVLCEGVFDAMRVGYSGIAILGKDLSKIQLRKIVEAFPRVTVLLDATAAVEARKIADQLYPFVETSIVFLPQDDPDSYETKDLQYLIKTTKVPYSLDLNLDVVKQLLHVN